MIDDVLTRHRFTAEDQERFAAFSGDRNPMHMDPDSARRTQAGACAVHGVHGVIWGLDRLRAAGLPLGTLVSLKADFAQFVTVGEEVSLVVLAREPGRLRAELRKDGTKATTLDLRFGAPQPLPAPPSRPARCQPDRPEEIALETLEGQSGLLLPPERPLAALYPDLATALDPARLEALALASTLVGMVIPGLHSIFAGLTLEFGPSAARRGLGFEVRRADPRFRLVTLGIDGPGLRGTLTAFLRYPPIAPPNLSDLAARVRPQEFADRHALIIGGSRGLGAATALLIAAGGGRVQATYHSGLAEAADLQARIGSDRCRIAPFDVGRATAPQLSEANSDITHVYYFATGRIRASPSGGFDRTAFDRYADVYLDGFARLAEHFGRQARGPLRMFYPSTVYVEARPRGLCAYAMAKAAGEILCSELARTWPNLRITAPRLPRVLTDQTATVPPVAAEAPVEIMLPLLRAENA